MNKDISRRLLYNERSLKENNRHKNEFNLWYFLISKNISSKLFQVFTLESLIHERDRNYFLFSAYMDV